MNTSTPRPSAAPTPAPEQDLAEFADLTRSLDHTLAPPAGAAPPDAFLHRVGARRRQVIRARAATAMTFAIAIAAAIFTLYVNRPSAPTGPLANLNPRQLDADNPGALLLVGSRGPGLTPSPRSEDPAAPSPATPRIRLGDGLDTDAVRALLAT